MVRLRPKESGILQVEDSVADANEKGLLHKSDVAKLRGQVGWTGSLTTGACGRIGLEVLKRIQQGGSPVLAEDDKLALQFLADVVAVLPERSLQVCGAKVSFFRLYSDAEWDQDDPKPPGLGWVLFPPRKKPQGRALVLPWSVVESWIPRRQQIFPAEAFAAYAALWHHREALAGQDLLLFVDNEAAASALIRGASSQDDVGAIVQAFHWLAAKIGCRVWIEWVDSESNPSDGLSHLGVEDPWTVSQDWELQEAVQPPWDAQLSIHKMWAVRTLGYC